MELLTVLITASVILNAYLIYQLTKKKKEKQPTYDAKQVLRELMSGDALVRIEVMDKDSIFLRSPKDMI